MLSILLLLVLHTVSPALAGYQAQVQSSSSARSVPRSKSSSSVRVIKRPVVTGSCGRQATFLADLDSRHLTCGYPPSLTAPVLLNGSCPVAACILKYRPGTTSPFGPLDF